MTRAFAILTFCAAIAKASSITARVFDADGKPIPKVQLASASGTIQTDANGIYVFPNAPPGRYYLRVEASASGVTTYYPNTLDPSRLPESTLKLEPFVRASISGSVKNPSSAFAGEVVTANGEPGENAALTILSEQPIEKIGRPTSIPTAADGSFEFKGLLPGDNPR